MELPGDEFDCPRCEATHTVQEDDDGFRPGLEFRKLYVRCPSVGGTIAWALVEER